MGMLSFLVMCFVNMIFFKHNSLLQIATLLPNTKTFEKQLIVFLFY